MRIVIDRKTPTINHLYGQKGFRRFLTKDAKELKLYIAKCVKEQCSYFVTAIGALQVEVKIYENWYNNDFSIARKDIANREKFLIDSVFEALGIDDKLIFKHTLIKVQSDKEYVEITIEDLRE